MTSILKVSTLQDPTNSNTALSIDRVVACDPSKTSVSSLAKPYPPV